MEHNMILSASGWRKVFAQSGNERDQSAKIGSVNKALCFLAAESFFEWLKARPGSGRKPKTAAAKTNGKAKKRRLKIVVATDTRPTGKECAEYALKALCLGGADAVCLGVAAAPEIMAFARSFDAFVYISASHNPIGHNGIKFGLDDGGVLNAAQNLEVRAIFERKLNEAGGAEDVLKRANAAKSAAFLKAVSKEKVAANKKASLAAYQKFSRLVTSGTESAAAQKKFFSSLKAALKKSGTIVCADFNGSAR